LAKSRQKTITDRATADDASVGLYKGAFLKHLYTLPEKAILKQILNHPAPRDLIQQMPSADFFWLVKKMDEEGAVQLLRLGSTEQWQYTLDLELWRKDRLDLEQTSFWLRRLQLADPNRLAAYLFTDGQALNCYYLFRSIQVIIRDEDETYDLDEGFITLDGLFYIKVLDPERMETIEAMLRTMADADFLRYQSLLLNLAGILPAELEEDMYRMKNVRLAEYGFLPREEAFQVYAPLNPQSLASDNRMETAAGHMDENVLEMAPYSPLFLLQSPNLLTKALSRVNDPSLADRIRLEFAGLCNQILSADGLPTYDMEVLRKTCRKSAGYMNVIIEKMCGEDARAAEMLVMHNPLISLFRAGFGLALRLKWKAEQWLRKSWFRKKGMGFDFWGETWGYPISGLTAKQPLYYDREEGDGVYRAFERHSELTEVETILHRLMGLDRLLTTLDAAHPLDQNAGDLSELTFHSLLFTLWARWILDLTPSFQEISLADAKRLFRFLRSGEKRPPYNMAVYEDVFVSDLLARASDWNPLDKDALKDTLRIIWQNFCREYERVPLNALDRRFSPYLLIKPSPGSAPR